METAGNTVSEIVPRSVHYRGIWGEDEYETQEELHDLCLNLITQLRNANKRRARWLMLAISLESVAVVALAIGVLQVLL
jgi:hypothetical protein